MMSSTETVLVSEIIPAPRARIYAAWLDSDQHSAFTGESAEIDPTVGGHHTTFGGYARGRNLELSPNRRIVQTWRSAEFPDAAPDSRIEVTFEDTAGGTLVSVLHTEIPPGQADRYREGWLRFYLEPMKRYFRTRLTNGTNGSHRPFAGRSDAHDDHRIVYDSGHSPDPGQVPHVRSAAQSSVVGTKKKRAVRPSSTLTRKAQMKTKKSTKSAAKSKSKAKSKAKKKAAKRAPAKKKAKKKATRRR